MIDDLTPEEQEIENAEEETRPVTAERRKAIERIVERSKKTEAISLRLSLRQLRWNRHSFVISSVGVVFVSLPALCRGATEKQR